MQLYIGLGGVTADGTISDEDLVNGELGNGDGDEGPTEEEEEEEEDGEEVVVETDNGYHQDLISGMAVNEEGTLLASCSIDGTVRIWDVLVKEFGDDDDDDDMLLASNRGGSKVRTTEEGRRFLERVERFGCPIRPRKLLAGHVGWVNGKTPPLPLSSGDPTAFFFFFEI